MRYLKVATIVCVHVQNYFLLTLHNVGTKGFLFIHDGWKRSNGEDGDPIVECDGTMDSWCNGEDDVLRLMKIM